MVKNILSFLAFLFAVAVIVGPTILMVFYGDGK
jgi:hypothetical protein